MLGPALLVAPAPVGESPAAYPITLPGAGWYDYWTGLRIDASRWSETPRLERLPVFVRPGAILPRQPLVQSTSQTPAGPLQLAVYPGPDCRGTLYLDDGASFAYRSGAFLRQAVRCQVRPGDIRLDFDAREGRYAPWWREIDVEVHGMASAPHRVMQGGAVLQSRYDALAQTLHVTVPDPARGAELRIQSAYRRGESAR
jgi:alpha-glucosidase